MARSFSYIVLEKDAKMFFVSKAQDLSTDFDDVMRFVDKDMALEYIKKNGLDMKRCKVLTGTD